MKNENAKSKRKAIISEIIPFVVLIVTLLMIGLCLIKNFFEVKFYGIIYNYSFLKILGGEVAGKGISIFFLAIYVVLPLLATSLFFLKSFHKNFGFASMFIFLTCAVISIVGKDVLAQIMSEAKGTDVSVKSTIVSTLPTIFLFILFGITLSTSAKEINFTIRDITESGILIAAALVLNFIPLFKMPTGGSVNFQMLPLFILAIRRGPLKGFIGCGIIYGILSCLTDGYGFAFFPFDYLLAFGGVAVFGLFSKYILPENVDGYNLKGELMILAGGLCASVIRFVGGCISSMLFYDYSLKAAALYNVGYVFVSAGLALVIIMALYGPLLKVNKIFPAERA